KDQHLRRFKAVRIECFHRCDLARVGFGLQCTWQLMDVTSVELGNDCGLFFAWRCRSMSKWFEYSNVNWFRRRVEDCLIEQKKLQPSKDKEESAVKFWARMERAGLLEEALMLYDQIAEINSEWVHTPRETKKMFAERIEREGRQAEVEEKRES